MTTTTGTVIQNGCCYKATKVIKNGAEIELGGGGGGGTQVFDYIIVGGGGGGVGGAYPDSYSWTGYGAGGGGEVKYGTKISQDKCYNIIIGTGGNGTNPQTNYSTAPLPGCPGSSSCLGNIVAKGGCGGGSGCLQYGGDSGSGYSGYRSTDYSAGGGGGAGGNASGRNGGTGLCGYGGGGAAFTSPGSSAGQSGTATCGGGTGNNDAPGCGGGGGGGGGRHKGGNGGGGIIKICYLSDGSYGITCATGGTVTTSGNYTVHTFTSNGTFCIVC